MKQKLFYSIIVLFVLINAGCEKDNNNGYSNGKVELYLIDTFSVIDNSYQIDESN